MKRAEAAKRYKTTKRWSQKLQIETRWTDTNQRIQLLRQAAQFIDDNYTKGIFASDIHKHLGLHARKVNDIFERFYGVSTSTYLRFYKCKILFENIKMAPNAMAEDHYKAAGITGNPGEKRAFKSLYGISVEEHWSQSRIDPAGNQEGRGRDSRPSALAEAEQMIKQLQATISEPNGSGPQAPRI